MANEYAISARELRRKVEQNPRTIDPLCEWIKSERTWSKAVVTLQSIDPSTASGKIAQEKLGDYISNYEATKRRRELTEYDTVNWAYDFSCQL